MPQAAVQQSPTLESREYFEAAVLRAARIPFEGMRFEAGKVVFLFEDEDGKASDTLSRHRNGALKLATLSLVSAINLVKSEMFDYRRNRGFA